jgi:hypothetical protein
MSLDDKRLATILMTEVLQPKWQNVQTFQEVADELDVAGFKDIRILSGSTGIMPTVMAVKV